MRVRDIAHALELSKALHRFARHLRDDDPGDEGGMTDDETCKALTFARALEATFDDVVRRQGGFGLVEAIVASGIGLVIVGMLATFMLTMGRSAALLAKAHEQRALAQGRLERTLQHIDTPEDGVTITWDDSAAPCRLAHLVTSDTFNHTYEVYATRGCLNQ